MGLFCSEPIAEDTVIEDCLTVTFNAKAARKIDDTPLFNYYISLHFLSAEQAKVLHILDKENAGCLALGAASIANHSETPNAHLVPLIHNDRIIISLRSKVTISANEEITISYGQPDDLWFQPH